MGNRWGVIQGIIIVPLSMRGSRLECSEHGWVRSMTHSTPDEAVKH